MYFFFGGNTFSLNQMVVSGDLDLVLIKPVSTQFFMSLRYVASYSIISFIILISLLIKLVQGYHGVFLPMNFLLFILLW